ncbi:phosphatidylglycerophosphate synthase [Oleiphilus messinensis]|uniref:CDP-diacylglycerol--glycerol-3-phosphate 3-phosphatidyltransferase n=1 Tax=Oleiphilus messinensis TaxID=141451 RepID=A0A1Y0IE38_9GAMM|nr:CDP-alcohol phosphatidyltransferase family protein [Oleiphilus messinensis]ARU57644.1 phosphatidylglycerophosphate synthase [Oleiphilus messinensis]
MVMIEQRHIPNILTFGRMILVLPIVSCLYSEYYRQALALFFVAGLTDAIDGFLARKFEWKSRLGAIVDPLADKLLLVSAFIALTFLGKIALWLTVLVFARDVVIVCGGVYYRYTVGTIQMAPSRLGKLSTLAQITFVLVVIISLAGLPMPEKTAYWGQWLVAILCVASGVQYVWVWSRKTITEAVSGTDAGKT